MEEPQVLPGPEGAAVEGLAADDFTTLEGTWELAKEQGLTLVWTRTSSEQDWDRYETVQAANAAGRAAARPPNLRSR